MRLWVPLAVVALIAFAYAFFYFLNSTEAKGASSFGLANTVGLLAVFLGLIAAGIILRRAKPPL
jgi:hypothetical protein